MERFVIGEGYLTLKAVWRAMEDSGSYSVLLGRWKRFARNLEIDEAEIYSLSRMLNLETNQLYDIAYEVLHAWTKRNGTKATLPTLCKALENSEILNIAEFLRRKFCLLKLDKHGKVVTLETLLYEDPTCQPDIKNLINSRYFNLAKPIHLFNENVRLPTLPPFYIPRLVSRCTQLDKGMFSDDSTRDHVFLVRDISLDKLREDIGKHVPIERSSSQLKQVSHSFIILEIDQHFDKICKITNQSVHAIRYTYNSYFWIRSSKGLDVLSKFCKSESTIYKEKELVNMIVTNDRTGCRQYCISDSPGMGKSMLLNRLANEVNALNNALALFINLDKFINHNLQVDCVSDPAYARQLLIEYSAFDELAKQVLLQIMNFSNNHFCLFFDGYDEVLPNQLDKVDNFLKLICMHDNVKVVLSTRPHFQKRAEQVLTQLAFEIVPFSTTNKCDFLVNCWNSQNKALKSEILSEFAEHCLSALESKMTDSDRQIAGIPLQCKILAEVYANDALAISKENALPSKLLEAANLFQMYGSVVQLKFDLSLGKQSNEIKQKYAVYHVLSAVKLLFPHWHDKLKYFLPDEMTIDHRIVYRIGLIEQISVDNGAPKFIHRTFAEYILAQFLVQNLKYSWECAHLVFEVILGPKRAPATPSMEFPSIMEYELEYSVIAYFINMHLENYCLQDLLNSPVLLKYATTDTFTNNIFVALVESLCNSLERCFDLAKSLLGLVRPTRKKELQYEYLKYLPQFAVEVSVDITFLVKVLDLLEHEFQINDLNHALFQHEQLNCFTPLHIAVSQGKYNIVFFLIRQCNVKYSDDQMKRLWHMCLRNSANNSDIVIGDKLSILLLLNEKIPQYLNEPVDGVVPLLEQNVHLSLLKRLIEIKANINAVNTRTNYTLFHTFRSKTISEYEEFVTWALLNKFNQIDKADSFFKVTPLMLAIREFGHVSDKTLNLFYNAKVDFNAKDEFADSILFHALRYSKNESFIQSLIEYGASANHVNEMEENAAHFLIKGCDFLSESSYLISVINLLISKGFVNLDSSDINGQTPLCIAVQSKNLPKYVLDFFAQKTCNFNAKDRKADSILFSAIACGQNNLIIQEIIKNGGDLLHRNLLNQTAFHIAAESANSSALQILLDSKLDSKIHINSIDKMGNTPLHLLLCNEKSNYEMVLKLLLVNGANLVAKNNQGRTPISSWILRTYAITLKWWFNMLPLFDEFVTKSIASYVLTDILGHNGLLQTYLAHDSSVDNNDEKVSNFLQIFNYLIRKGGRLRLYNRDLAIWNKLNLVSLNEIFGNISLTDGNDCLNSCDFLEQFPHVEIEVLLINLLRIKKYEYFVKLCNALAEGRNRWNRRFKCILSK